LGAGQFIGSGTNYVEWDNLFGEGMIFESGTIYLGVGLFTWERDNLLGVGQFIWRGTIYLGPGQFSGRGPDF
jgi:hypothetical protein